MGQRRSLGLAGIIEQAARCREGQRHVVAAESGKVTGSELLGQQPVGGFEFEMPRRPAPRTTPGRHRLG